MEENIGLIFRTMQKNRCKKIDGNFKKVYLLEFTCFIMSLEESETILQRRKGYIDLNSPPLRIKS